MLLPMPPKFLASLYEAYLSVKREIWQLFHDSKQFVNTDRMTRKLKYHEARLLRKHDFVGFNKADSHRDANVIRRYMIQDRNDYVSCTLQCDSKVVY
jgi:hypothetical protein